MKAAADTVLLVASVVLAGYLLVVGGALALRELFR